MQLEHIPESSHPLANWRLIVIFDDGQREILIGEDSGPPSGVLVLTEDLIDFLGVFEAIGPRDVDVGLGQVGVMLENARIGQA